MIKRATINDLEQVRTILTEDSVYQYMIDDGCPPAKDYDPTPLLSSEAVYILFLTDSSLMMFMPINSFAYDQHVCILPQDRKQTKELCLSAWEYMFTQTTCEKIVAAIPTFNFRAQATAQNIGFEKEGYSKKSFKRDGKLYDRILYGITKGEWLCLG